MKKTGFNRWCDKLWLLFSLCISGLMILLTLFHWEDWSASLKLTAALTALIPVHATEEWFFPGGFAYQYNTFLQRSKQPTHTPMNRASDMVTVLGTTVMYAILTLVFAFTNQTLPVGVLLAGAFFSLLEISFHTFCGISAFLRFKKRGKSTIYGPGSMTAYTGFLPLAGVLFRTIHTLGVTGLDIGICVLLLGITAVLCLAPEAYFKKRSYLYAFPSNGYYDRYLL